MKNIPVESILELVACIVDPKDAAIFWTKFIFSFVPISDKLELSRVIALTNNPKLF